MTHDEQRDALTELAQRLRSRIRGLAEELDALPLEQDEKKQAVITWRCTLLALIWDVSEAPLTLAKTGTEQIRASRILTRCLLEYGMRLEYYFYEPEEAVRDSKNAEVWLRGIVKGGTTSSDLARWNKEQLRAYNEMMKVRGEVKYQELRTMSRKVYEGRGHAKKDVERAVRELNNFYGISSSFVHGSQGIFWDLLESAPSGEPWPLHFRSFRLTQAQVLNETVNFLIQAVYAESVHRRRDLGYGMYRREQDLITGDWNAGDLGANPTWTLGS